MRLLGYSLVVLMLAALAGCASMFGGGYSGARQAGSIVDYLYPNAKEPPALQQSVTYLRPPVRVGIAFTPSVGYGSLPEAEKTRLLERVRGAFTQYSFIGNIEIIPTSYLRPRGGFDNLEQAARMFNVDVVALVSYDQVRFNDTNSLAVLYWTIVGAYVVKGDKYDVQTLLDAAVFDVKSRKLLFRAPGTSQVKGTATMAGFSEKARAAQEEGYRQAVDQLIPNLKDALADFRERIKSDHTVQVANREGYKGGGSVGWPAALAALAALFAVRVHRHRAA